MSKKAGIYKEYLKNFKLDEPKLRKICDVMQTHSEKISEETYLHFYVSQEDNSFYETYDIEDIIKDDNVPGKSIRRLLISVVKGTVDDKEISDGKRQENTIAHCAFTRDRYEKVSYSIQEKERAWCYLLADDLDSQIQRTLQKSFLTTVSGLKIDFSIFLILMALALLAFSFFGTRSEPLVPLDSIPTMTNEMILQTLIEHEVKTSMDVNWIAPLFMVSVAVFMILLQLNPISALIKKLNKSVFYWGDMKIDFDNFSAKVKRIKWGVGIAFFVSVSSGIIVALILG